MRFVHFEDFRYSADLDFSLVGGNFEDGCDDICAEPDWSTNPSLLREGPGHPQVGGRPGGSAACCFRAKDSS